MLRPKMEDCYHIWAGADQYSLSSLDIDQKRLRRLVSDDLLSTLQHLLHGRNIASLSLFTHLQASRFQASRFHWKCSNELHTLVPQTLILLVKTPPTPTTLRRATPIPYSFSKVRVPIGKSVEWFPVEEEKWQLCGRAYSDAHKIHFVCDGPGDCEQQGTYHDHSVHSTPRLPFPSHIGLFLLLTNHTFCKWQATTFKTFEAVLEWNNQLLLHFIHLLEFYEKLQTFSVPV